ncbi:MAG: MlaD family protein [Litoreibacter sp.]|nr:MlaD family protein [Litoreibacter sp.]
MAEAPSEVKIEPASGGFGVSMVWIIPLIALAVALGVAWQSYSNQGPVITIEFENGTGIQADETQLKYRDITVGVVEDVGFTDGLESVEVTVRLDKDVAPFIDQSANFWVVRPEVSARGITGLSTVLSGVFIEGVWDTEIGNAATRFRGLEEPPLFRPSEPGLQIALRATANGQLTENAPIFFHGIEVGRIGKAHISPRTNFAIAEAVIYEPHDRLITASTRFWDTSGFSVSIGASGAEIDFTSLATLISGGVSFDTFVSGGERVADGTEFQVFSNEENARNSVFNASEVEELQLSVVFDDNISGLVVGSRVELSGLTIGEVQSVNGIIDRARFGDARVRLNAVLTIQPARLGLEGTPSPTTALNFLAGRVREGLRARLTSAGLLTGGLKIELVQVDDALPAAIEDLNVAVPTLPTTSSAITDAGASVEGVLTRVGNLPIEELLTSAIDFLNTAQAFVASDGLQDVPAEVTALLGDMRGFVGSDDMQNVPVALNALLGRMELILTQLEQEQLVMRLRTAVDAAAGAAEGIDGLTEDVEAAVAGLPALLTSLQGVAVKAENLPIEDLVSELTDLTKTADGVIGSDGFKALPADLSAALAEIEATLKALREGGVIENANATLASARNAADAVAGATADLPALMDRMASVLNQASSTIRGFDQGESLSRDVEAALRDIQKAAQALASLARTIERNPSSLIRGR